MNVTFIIGNGFDLACGLDTRYTDVYKEYNKTESINDNIKNFKEILKKNEYGLWTDFEMALPGFAKELNDFDKFVECVEDFIVFLSDYLKEQQLRINIEDNRGKLSIKMQEYIYRLHQFCLLGSSHTLKSLIDVQIDNTVFQFVNFNYTNTLELCVNCLESKRKSSAPHIYTVKPPRYIHAQLGQGIKLGLDNEEFYKDIPHDDIDVVNFFLDKVYRNSQFSRITDEVASIIGASRIIVIFGWSMGDSDSSWVRYIKECMSKNEKLHLVYAPYYPEKMNQEHTHRRLTRDKDKRKYIVEKLELDDQIAKRVHIISADNYMDLRFLAKAKESTQESMIAKDTIDNGVNMKDVVETTNTIIEKEIANIPTPEYATEEDIDSLFS